LIATSQNWGLVIHQKFCRIVVLVLEIYPGHLKKGVKAMGESGKRDKGNKEEKKKPKLTQKEKRKLKNEKKKLGK